MITFTQCNQHPPPKIHHCTDPATINNKPALYCVCNAALILYPSDTDAVGNPHHSNPWLSGAGVHQGICHAFGTRPAAGPVGVFVAALYLWFNLLLQDSHKGLEDLLHFWVSILQQQTCQKTC